MLVVVAHGETASLCRCHGGGDGDGGGGNGGSGGDGGGDDGGGRGGKITVASWTLRALASMPRLLASDEVMAIELRVVAVVAAASEAEPCRMMLMVTAVDVAIGVVTVTFCPSALANEPVSALCSWAASVAFALRLSAVPAGMAMTKVTSMPLCSRRPSGPSPCSSPCSRRPEPIVTLQPAGCPLQTLLWTLARSVVGSAPAGSSRPNVDLFSTMTSALGLAPVDARRAVMISAAFLPSVASEVSATPTDAVKERGGKGGDDGGEMGGDGGGGDGGDAGGEGGGGVGEGEGGGGDNVDPGTPARQQVLRQMSLYSAGEVLSHCTLKTVIRSWVVLGRPVAHAAATPPAAVVAR